MPDSTLNSRAGFPPITISALHYAWETPEEACERCRNEFGLDGIEFSIHEGAGRPHLLDSEYEHVAALGRSYGLQLSAHVWGDLARISPDDALAQLRRWLALSRHMALTHLVAHGGSHDNREAGLATMADVLAEVAPEYAAAGVTLCIENHYAWEYRDCHELYGSAEELEDLFARIPSPGLGFCLDYGHSHMTGNTLGLLQRVGHRLVYTHLADNLGEHDDHLMFGQGTVRWREMFAATRDIGYRGPFTVEFPVREDTGPLRACVELIRDIYR